MLKGSLPEGIEMVSHSGPSLPRNIAASSLACSAGYRSLSAEVYRVVEPEK